MEVKHYDEYTNLSREQRLEKENKNIRATELEANTMNTNMEEKIKKYRENKTNGKDDSENISNDIQTIQDMVNKLQNYGNGQTFTATNNLKQHIETLNILLIPLKKEKDRRSPLKKRGDKNRTVVEDVVKDDPLKSNILYTAVFAIVIGGLIKYIEHMGGGGGPFTNKIKEKMKEIINEMKENNKITQEQYNNLMQKVNNNEEIPKVDTNELVEEIKEVAQDLHIDNEQINQVTEKILSKHNNVIDGSTIQRTLSELGGGKKRTKRNKKSNKKRAKKSNRKRRA